MSAATIQCFQGSIPGTLRPLTLLIDAVLSDGRDRKTSLRTLMPILRSKSSAARAGKPETQAQPSPQKLQEQPKSQESSVSPNAGNTVRSLGNSRLKRSRGSASSASQTPPPLENVQPEQPVPVKKTKARKALLNTLWTAEELTPLKAKTEQLYNQLNQLYVDPPCPLDYGTPFQLLVAVILSAQVGN